MKRRHCRRGPAKSYTCLAMAVETGAIVIDRSSVRELVISRNNSVLLVTGLVTGGSGESSTLDDIIGNLYTTSTKGLNVTFTAGQLFVCNLACGRSRICMTKVTITVCRVATGSSMMGCRLGQGMAYRTTLTTLILRTLRISKM